MKCKIFASGSIKNLEDQINLFLEHLTSYHFVESKLIHEPQYESETYDVIASYIAMIIVKGDNE